MCTVPTLSPPFRVVQQQGGAARTGCWTCRLSGLHLKKRDARCRAAMPQQLRLWRLLLLHLRLLLLLLLHLLPTLRRLLLLLHLLPTLHTLLRPELGSMAAS